MLPALIGALGSMASTIVSNNMNREAAEDSNMRNLRNWAGMAEYNSPFNQVKRLRKAGINPALAMQQGAMDSGSMSSPPPDSVTPSYDFSPTSQAFMQSAELAQVKRLQDAQIENQQAVTQNQMIRNRTQLLHDFSEIMEKMSEKGLKDTERSYYEWLAKNLQKDYESYDERIGADVSLKNAQKEAEDAHASYLEAQAEYQKILNQFEPEKQKKIVANLEKQGREIESAIRKNDADAAHSAALKALTDAQKEGVDMDNDIKENIADSVVDKAASEADEQFWKSQQSAKDYLKGWQHVSPSYEVGTDKPVFYGDTPRSGNGVRRHYIKWKRKK